MEVGDEGLRKPVWGENPQPIRATGQSPRLRDSWASEQVSPERNTVTEDSQTEGGRSPTGTSWLHLGWTDRQADRHMESVWPAVSHIQREAEH